MATITPVVPAIIRSPLEVETLEAASPDAAVVAVSEEAEVIRETVEATFEDASLSEDVDDGAEELEEEEDVDVGDDTEADADVEVLAAATAELSSEDDEEVWLSDVAELEKQALALINVI